MKALFTDVMHLLQVTRSVSAAGKPHGHGIVEKWNRDLAQITAKMCKSGSADTSWRSIVPIACESTNVTIYAPTSEGATGVAPCEVMLGIKPRISNVPNLEHETRSKRNAAPGSRDHLELIARAKRIALDRMNEARAKYEETMDQAARNQSRLTKSFQPGEVVRYAIHYRDRMDNKQHPSYSERMVVVDDLGFHKYIVQPFGDLGADVIECHADDMRPERLFSKIVAEAAQRQATDALHQITEHEIEEIKAERGVISQGTKEYLVKWVGYPVSTWERASNFDADCQPLRDFKANKRKSTSTRSTALIATKNYFDPLASECDQVQRGAAQSRYW